MVVFLTCFEKPTLQFESAWVLTNIASETSDNTYAVVESGAVPIFCQLLKCNNAQVKEQAVWAIGNIAGDSPACRDLVLNTGALKPMLNLMNSKSQISLLRNCIWTLSNLCRSKPQPRFENISAVIPVVTALLYSYDSEVLIDCCWALSYLSDGTNDKIQAVLDAGIAKRLTRILTDAALSPNAVILVPALRTIGNIVTGDDEQTDEMVASGVLTCLGNMLIYSFKKSIRKEACWTLSNI